jgi:hypothetical protein
MVSLTASRKKRKRCPWAALPRVGASANATVRFSRPLLSLPVTREMHGVFGSGSIVSW